MQRSATGLVRRWQSNPAQFAHDVLGVDTWSGQREILDSVVLRDRTVVRSGQKTGKSTAIAIVAIWWALLRPRGKVVLTAPAYHQIKNILWPEVTRLYRNSRYRIGGTLHKAPDSGLELPDERGIFCVSTDKPERLAGLSGENLLICIDEASGFPEDLWDPIFGNLAGGGKLLATGNPTRTSGPFFAAFGVGSEFWGRVHLNSELTPNALARSVVIPGLATYDWVEERRREWGVESAAYQIRVLGNFPTQADDCVIALREIHAANDRFGKTQPVGVLHIGVDVARYGDDETVIVGRRNYHPLEQRASYGNDGPAVAGRVVEYIRDHRIGNEPVRIKVDVIGYGSSAFDHLNFLRSEEKPPPELDGDVLIEAVNVSESADAEEYERLRDQLWFGLRDWLRAGGALPEDPRLESELAAPRYSITSRGKLKVESKDEIKKRLSGKSPDRADAWALCVYEGTSAPVDASWVDEVAPITRWEPDERGYG